VLPGPFSNSFLSHTTTAASHVGGSPRSPTRLADTPAPTSSRADSAAAAASFSGPSQAGSCRDSFAGADPPHGAARGEALGGFFVGQWVHVWSNGVKMWFDGTVDEIATSVVEDMYQGEVRQVQPGSIKLRYDGRVKWLPIAKAEDELRKVHAGAKDISHYGWREMRPGDALPDRAVRSGSTPTDGEVFVACNPLGEPGKLSLEASEEGPRRMGRIWCPPGGDGAERGQALVLRPRHVARWVPVCWGDQLPAGAVPARAAPKGEQVYVARHGEEAGRLSAAEGRVLEVRSHHAGGSSKGDVLVVEEVARELEVEVLKTTSLQNPGYRMFDGLRKSVHRMRGTNSFSPYVSVSFGDLQWRSTCRTQVDGEAFYGERAYFPVPAGEAPASSLQFKAKDERGLRQMVGIHGNPTIGAASLDTAQFDSTEEQTLELMRSGTSQGRLTARLRWHGGRPGSP